MSESGVSIDCIYAETCSNIRATDDISFKLLGTVPLLPGAAFVALFFKEKIAPGNERFVLALSVFAAVITLGLFRWELRNIQTCSWLLRRVEAMEREWPQGFRKRPAPRHGIAKTAAEKWVYSLTIVSWLMIPMLVSESVLKGGIVWGYGAAALFILFLTAKLVREDIHVEDVHVNAEAVSGSK